MWQNLYSDLKDHNFVVVAVAMDTAESARPWIEAAKPTYPCLIDNDHHVADLYNMVNVPQAVWIDERGRMVRPPENAGASDGFRSRDRTTGVLGAEQLAERERIKGVYVDAVRDWVVKGASSEHALGEADVRQRLYRPDPAIAEAHAHMRLAGYLMCNGRQDAAGIHAAAASRLHPQSWNIWRQAAKKEPTGFAAGPEFWARVEALGDRPYYLPIDMKGM